MSDNQRTMRAPINCPPSDEERRLAARLAEAEGLLREACEAWSPEEDGCDCENCRLEARIRAFLASTPAAPVRKCGDCTVPVDMCPHRFGTYEPLLSGGLTMVPAYPRYARPQNPACDTFKGEE